MSTRPSQFPDFCTNNTSNMVAPSASTIAQGYLPGQVLPAQNFNYSLASLGAWVRYLEGTLSATTTLSTIDPNIRFLGGGTFAWSNSTSTLSWSEPLAFAYPGLNDSQNTLAAGSITLPAGSVAYVTTNNPVVMSADTTKSSTTLSNVLRPSDLQIGWQASGAGIASGTTIAAIDVAAQTVTLSAAATTTAAQVPVSFARVGALTASVAPMSSYVATANGVIFARATDSSCVVGVGTGQMILGDTEQKRLLRQGFGATVHATAGVAVSQGQAVYMSSGADGRTAGSVYPCDTSAANGLTRGKLLGFVYGAAAAGDTARVVCSGIFPVTQTLVAGLTYYVDPATPGGLVAARTSKLSEYVVPAGVAVSTKALMLPPQMTSAPATLENLCDKFQFEVGSARFETAYSANSDLGLYKAFPSSSGTLTAGFWRNFPGAPYCLQADVVAQSAVTGGLGFYLYYAYIDGTTAAGGLPLGAGLTGTALSGGMTQASYGTSGGKVYQYSVDFRARSLRLDSAATLFGAVRSSSAQSANNAIVASMTLAYPPA